MRSCLPSPKRCKSSSPSVGENSCGDFGVCFRGCLADVLFCVCAPLREVLVLADARVSGTSRELMTFGAFLWLIFCRPLKRALKFSGALIPGFRFAPPGATLCRLLRRLVESLRHHASMLTRGLLAVCSTDS